MKKIVNQLSLLIAVLALVLVPLAKTVHAADDVIPIDSDLGSSDSSSTSTTSDTDAGVPDTGIAPKQQRFIANLIVFSGGSLAGGLLGLALVQRRRSRAKEQIN